MYQFSYAEVMQDAVADAKERERQILDRSVVLLEAAAQDKERYGREAIEALFYTRRVWISFIEDLKNPENQLPIELRANLISIAIWILKECERIRKRQSTNYQGIIDVTTIIRDGLK
jgi:flagellar biosynthesis activator protein FlaF